MPVAFAATLVVVVVLLLLLLLVVLVVAPSFGFEQVRVVEGSQEHQILPFVLVAYSVAIITAAFSGCLAFVPTNTTTPTPTSSSTSDTASASATTQFLDGGRRRRPQQPLLRVGDGGAELVQRLHDGAADADAAPALPHAAALGLAPG